jgi:hypothetical protein
MWSYPGPRRRRFGRLGLERRSVVASPETIGLTWLWTYFMVWMLFGLWMHGLHPSRVTPGFWNLSHLSNYLMFWLGDNGGPASVQLSVMSIQVLMVIYLWVRYRGLRHDRRVPLAAYLLLAGMALLLLAQQQVFRAYSFYIEVPSAFEYPATADPVPIPDPTPETP